MNAPIAGQLGGPLGDEPRLATVAVLLDEADTLADAVFGAAEGGSAAEDLARALRSLATAVRPFLQVVADARVQFLAVRDALVEHEEMLAMLSDQTARLADPGWRREWQPIEVPGPVAPAEVHTPPDGS